MNSFTTLSSFLAFTTIGMSSASVTINNNQPTFDMTYCDVIPYKQRSNAQLQLYSYIVYGAGDKKDFKARYAAMANSEWFKKAYYGKSLGDSIKIED